MIRPREIARALGGSALMVDAASDHRTWRDHWLSIECSTWLAYYATQVAVPREATLSALEQCVATLCEHAEIDPEEIVAPPSQEFAAPGEPPSAARERYVRSAVSAAYREAANHADMLPAFMSCGRNLMLGRGVAVTRTDPFVHAIHAVIDADTLLTRLAKSPWLDPSLNPVRVRRAKLSTPLLDDGRRSVRSTQRQQLYIVDEWLVVDVGTTEIHHPMRLVDQVERTSEEAERGG